jgi:hypothetical protein
VAKAITLRVRKMVTLRVRKMGSGLVRDPGRCRNDGSQSPTRLFWFLLSGFQTKRPGAVTRPVS